MVAQRPEDLRLRGVWFSVDSVKSVESVPKLIERYSAQPNRRSGQHEEFWNHGFDGLDGFY